MLRIAILDLYEGYANQGMRCIRQIIQDFSAVEGIPVYTQEFDVRLKNEVPDLSFDLFISSGGPGSPLDTIDTAWEKAYFEWFAALEQWNGNAENMQKKPAFFICHSFQLICRHYGVGTVNKRKSTSFGVFPIHPVVDVNAEPVFNGLKNPFYAVDSRDYQVIQPNHQRIRQLGAKILCIEKDRPHIPLERAIMSIRFNPWMMGTQFHPEADAIGMSMYLQTEEKKQTVIAAHGEEKWSSMIEHLEDPDKIMYTQQKILPNFLKSGLTYYRPVKTAGIFSN
ncbi:MAG: GMP synthase [Chitinophagaceae bacterium]|jgi:GMP synthase-like glutamine amidotransferase|nr:GMP synthase [Chitinophagaceae bacterium]